MSRLAPRRKRRAHAEVKRHDLSKLERVCEELRHLQWQTNCSTQTLQTFLSALRGKFGDLIRDLEPDELPRTVQEGDDKMQSMVRFCLLSNREMNDTQTIILQAGEETVFLHGCVGCDNKVWAEEDVGETCPQCGADRYDESGKAKEFVVHFPIAKRMKSLLSLEQYYNAVRWECDRTKKNDEYVTGL